jgi:[acyl-carrier-protein] S-malonyltransferase
MGKDLADSFPAAAEVFERADAALGSPISEICFNGPEDDLKQTINTQPALYVTSAAALAVAYPGSQPFALCSLPRQVGFTAGHSVGEYAALYAAGAFSFETGLKLVRKRAELMQQAAEANRGTMAAILGLAPDQVLEAVEKASGDGLVVAANFNSPIQTVISGDEAGVARASEIASEMGAKRVVPLSVSGAFHSPLMQAAADALADELKLSEITDPAVPVVANYTADFETTAGQVRENLAKQITGSVRWVESVQRMLDSGVDAFIELGSGNVLAGLIKRIAPDAEVYSVGDSASVEAILVA